MIQLQNPLLRFHKTTKGNFSGEDFQISPTVSFLDDSDSLAQIMPYWKTVMAKNAHNCMPYQMRCPNQSNSGLERFLKKNFLPVSTLNISHLLSQETKDKEVDIGM